MQSQNTYSLVKIRSNEVVAEAESLAALARTTGASYNRLRIMSSTGQGMTRIGKEWCNLKKISNNQNPA